VPPAGGGLIRYAVRVDQRQLGYLAHRARGPMPAGGLLVSYEQWRPAAQIRPGDTPPEQRPR